MGTGDGTREGAWVGRGAGACVGTGVGASVGPGVGAGVGSGEGAGEGGRLGYSRRCATSTDSTRRKQRQPFCRASSRALESAALCRAAKVAASKASAVA